MITKDCKSNVFKDIIIIFAVNQIVIYREEAILAGAWPENKVLSKDRWVEFLVNTVI